MGVLGVVGGCFEVLGFVWRTILCGLSYLLKWCQIYKEG